MKVFRGSTFATDRPWGTLDIANMDGITMRLHWTDKPYKWHVNDGDEVFAVLDSRVEMRYRVEGVEHSTVLQTGDVFYASVGTEITLLVGAEDSALPLFDTTAVHARAAAHEALAPKELNQCA